MAITYVGAGIFAAGTTDTATANFPAGSVGDIALGFYTTKPYSVSGTTTDETVFSIGSVISGEIAAGNDQGSVRASAVGRFATTTSSGSIQRTFTGNNVTGAQGLRFSKASNAVWSVGHAGLVDTVETGTAISATDTVATGEFAVGDVVIIHVAIKSDSINHTAQSLTIAGCTVGSITWLAKSSSTAGTDMSMYLGYATVTAGSATGNITYSATSSVSGGSSTAVNLVRLREVVPPNAPTNVAATLNTNNITVNWTAPATGTAPSTYSVYRERARLLGDNSTFTNSIGDWSTTGTDTIVALNGRLEVASNLTSAFYAYSPMISVEEGDVVNISVGTLVNVVGTRALSVTIRFFASTSESVSGTGLQVVSSTTAVAPAGAKGFVIRIVAASGAAGDRFALDNVTALVNTKASTVLSSTTSYVDTAGLPGTTYTYRIRAINSGAESVDSAAANVTTGSITLSLTTDTDSVNLSWNHPTGTSPTSYTINRTDPTKSDMAFVQGVTGAEGRGTSASATINCTPGNILLASAHSRGGGVASTVLTDAAGNTWVNLGLKNNGANASSTAGVALWGCIATNTFATPTASFINSGNQFIAMRVTEWTGGKLPVALGENTGFDSTVILSTPVAPSGPAIMYGAASMHSTSANVWTATSPFQFTLPTNVVTGGGGQTGHEIQTTPTARQNFATTSLSSAWGLVMAAVPSAKLTSFTSATTSYEDSTGLANTNYSYQVVSVHSSGTGTPSNSVSVTTGGVTLTATGDADSINLSWNRPAATNPTSYTLYKSYIGRKTYLESFNKENGTIIGPDLTWVEIVGSNLGISNNRLAALSQNASGTARAEHDTASDDMFAQMNIYVTGTAAASANMGVFCRASGSRTYYQADLQKLETNAASIMLYSYVNGTQTQLGSTVPLPDYVDGGLLRVEATGSTIVIYYEGTERLRVTDTTITTGKRAGVSSWRGNDSAAVSQGENFSYGDLSDGTVYDKITGITGLTYDDTAVLTGKTYTYTLKPVSSGDEGGGSNSVISSIVAFVADVFWKGVGLLRPWLSAGTTPWRS